ncbi:glycosyltransferase family 2 protein [Helicobacter pullorum]|uniref:Glycosyl transferase n=1 Tax=Helicobacter pullorum TaxID=35818 RepID=A0A0N1MRE6_9HELI|nr:glycosyltransferase family 2 protein [Helicobacter pullorum]KPH55950.1 glycosyl transferase [Helicobacter pullorum]OCR15852.1 glycosyl transferase [Helicobacter pullorum]
MKISILMPCYNSSKFLERSVGSVLKQAYRNFELICVDDLSSDNTYSILKEYAQKDSRIKVLQSDINGGCASPAFNLALKCSSGDFIFMLGHDDELSIDCLSSLVKRYNELRGEVDILIPDAFLIDENLKKLKVFCGVSNQIGSKNRILSGREAFELSLFWQISGFVLVRANIVRDKGFLVAGMNGDEFSVREFFLSANRVAFSKEGAYFYHQVRDSLTKKLSPRKFLILDVFKKLERLAKDKKLPNSTIKKINKERFRQLHNINSDFLQVKTNFTEEEVLMMEEYLSKHENDLKFYKTSFFDNIFRKETDLKGKFGIFFNWVKIYYKRIRDEA